MEKLNNVTHILPMCTEAHHTFSTLNLLSSLFFPITTILHSLNNSPPSRFDLTTPGLPDQCLTAVLRLLLHLFSQNMEDWLL